jgi:hypothetical protein
MTIPWRSNPLPAAAGLCLALGGIAAAGDDPRWAFGPLARFDAPADPTGWARGAIDGFIARRLAGAALAPSPEAERAALIRRLFLDLLGLPPDPEEVARFAADSAPDAYERLADRALASPRLGERWARHWLDVVRFAETHGFETNTPRQNAWPYRDWAIDAFNRDLPYDRFVFEQLAGDSCGADAATGFLVAGPWDAVKSPDVELTRNQRANELHDMVSTAGSAFLGLTVGCARCHDHKFDPITQRDYYALAAIVAGVQHGERDWTTPAALAAIELQAAQRAELAAIEEAIAGLESLAPPGRRAALNTRRNIERFAPVAARRLRFTILQSNVSEPCIDEIEAFAAGPERRNVALAAAGARARASSLLPGHAIHQVEHLNDGAYGNSRSWISNEPGAGWVEIEFAATRTIDCIEWGRDREGRFRDRLATRYRIEAFGDDGRSTVVASSEDHLPFGGDGAAVPAPEALGLDAAAAAKLADLRSRQGELSASLRAAALPAKVYAGVFTAPPATHRLHRGDPMQEREEVAPGGIAAAGAALALPAELPERERRIALARWLTGPAAPLSARVIANRIWHYHFGAGLVRTPSDFGAGGERPSHPELLDAIARDLIESGWSLKTLHRRIVLSAAYRQSSAPRADGLALDAEARLLWRFPPRRLEAEAIRDSMLAVSGALDLAIGGPGYEVFEPNDNYVHVYIARKRFGPDAWRRMVYQFKPRMQQDETFGAFDCPDAAQTAPRRTSSTTPLQALNLLNGGFVLEQAAIFAARLRRDAGEAPERQVERAFRLAFARAPDASERDAAAAVVREHGLEAFCRALFNASELIYLE